MKKRIIGLMLAFVMMLSVFAMPVEALAAKEQTVITILHTNDVHGNAQEDEKGGKLGFAKLKTFDSFNFSKQV